MTEYVTGLNARIGFPTEHLAGGHIDELAKPTYSTCIGLILKGYDDYEHNRKQFETAHFKVEVPETLKQVHEEEEENEVEEESINAQKIQNRKGMKDFWGKFKDGLIDLFKEEEDKHL